MKKNQTATKVYLFFLLVGLVLLAGCDSSKTDSKAARKTEAATQTDSVFSYDAAEFPGAKPWSSEKFKNNPDDFQFMILGDRTGGHNPLGTFERAMDQINLFQPEFVMTVGDFIEGYSSKQDVVDRQWDEIETMVAKLEMPFFYVRGNHDINTPMTRKVWSERRGPKYYHFLYKDVLFIALDSEDAERPLPANIEQDIITYGRLTKEDPKKAEKWLAEWLKTPEAEEAFGEETQIEFPEAQRAWFKKVLADHKDVRWTFVFVHQPIWNNPSESFKQIDSAIQGRDYTFFAGHTHYYNYDLINGHEYITVASAGAGFTRPGPGNVDHITWVTMTKKGPQIAGIALKGIFDRKGVETGKFKAFERGSLFEDKKPGRSLGIQSVPNLRDLGGYKSSDGATVVGGLVYRSNQLSGISEEDMKKLAALNLKAEFDLRTAEERDLRPDELPPGVKNVWLDVLADLDQAGPAVLEKLMKNPKAANEALGGGKAEANFRETYRQFVSLPSAKKSFGKLFLALGDQEQLPALFHCTTGKDRTGWATAALLTLLGVSRETIMQDYLRSNDYIIPQYQKLIDAFVQGGGEERIPSAILGVKKEYLDAAFEEMETKFGTIEKYFSEGLGIDAAEQKALRDLYLEKE